MYFFFSKKIMNNAISCDEKGCRKRKTETKGSYHKRCMYLNSGAIN